MTICIAAACGLNTDNPQIVLCSDTMRSGALGNAEVMLKIRVMPQNWIVSVAGGDDINPIVQLMRNAFIAANGEGKQIDDDMACEIVRTCLANRKKQMANEITLAKYAMTYDEFLAHGKARLPDEVFRDEMMKLRDVHFDAEFIVSGFAYEAPFLIETDRRGHIYIRDDFAVVGSGGYLAQSVLLHRQHSDVVTPAKALYNAWEAKKYAENERAVGRFTFCRVQQLKGRSMSLSPAGRKWLDDKYAELGPKAVPSDLTAPGDVLSPPDKPASS